MNPETEQPIVLTGITLPQDQFAHTDAPTEWWWHVGTLKAADGRLFGFEINAAMMFGNTFTQLEITDVANKKNYQKVTFIGPTPADWAQYDNTKQWFVKLGTEAPGDSIIKMNEIDGNALNMLVIASFTDADGILCTFELVMRQEAAPLLVWGTGVQTNVDPTGTSPITCNNYYYSLTNMNTSGTITIGAEAIEVKGLTWMDHEYGAFPKGYKWVFQNVQLDNGIHFSSFSAGGQAPTQNQPLKSFASILSPDGTTKYVQTTTTPLGPLYTFDNVTYFMQFQVVIDSDGFQATLMMETLVDDQVFIGTLPNSNVYEGIGKCTGTFNGSEVTGTAWIEQNLAPNPTASSLS